MRLIDADALEKRLHELALDEWNQSTATSWSNAFLECEDMVYDAPTVDTVKHGHWIYERLNDTRGGSYSVVYCSNCQAHVPWVTKYCLNCGAKMDEASE